MLGEDCVGDAGGDVVGGAGDDFGGGDGPCFAGGGDRFVDCAYAELHNSRHMKIDMAFVAIFSY